MAEQIFQGIELLPEAKAVEQLFILLHGVGAKSSDLVPLANKLRDAFPSAACLLPDGTFPFDGGGPFDSGGNRRQWFSISGVTEENRATRVAEAIPALHAMVRHAQDRFKVLQSDTALVGFCLLYTSPSPRD